LRWDVFTPTYEVKDRLSFFDPNGVNPSAGGLKGRLAFAGDKYGEASYGARFPEETWYRGFAPRVGIAWSLSPRTVIRSGYGIFFTQNYYPGWGGGGNLEGFNTTATFWPALNGLEPAMVLNKGFPQNFQKPPYIDPGYRNGRGIMYRPVEANRRPYSQQWNFTVERELPASVLLSLAYVGSKGTRLPSQILPANALDPKLLALGGRLNKEFGPEDEVMEGVNRPYPGWAGQMLEAGCSPSVAQALLPFPQYCSYLYAINENAGSSTYHSFQAKAERRFRSGTYVLASYTWSKLISDVQSTNPFTGLWNGVVGIMSPYERKRNKGLSVDDVAHVVSGALVFDLPFGKGKRFGLGASGAANLLIGGWSLNLIQRYNTGLPLLFRNWQNCTLPPHFQISCIPGVLKGRNPLLQDVNRIDVTKPLYDATAFEEVGTVGGAYYYGVGSRTTNLRGPRFLNTDFSIVKNVPFSIGDLRLNAQLRGEFFNIWNAHYFTTSGAQGDGGAFERSVGSPSFGMWNGAVTTPRNVQLTLRVTF
jgi:hypothetical protein